MNLRVDRINNKDKISNLLKKLNRTKLYIEKYSDLKKVSTELIEANNNQILNYINNPCNHSFDNGILIYDEPGFAYDIRYCAICNESVGYI